ncbi:hypothetical protein PUNSTDRAFT_144177 [Punctularia strigosozonata HHB-11173 SS5]|uniref:uncharacterized protein n=1 Tax=Punctularia strigosozonata (strain HHB-11173) TaxID=741275 RepID=UPI0004417528|nr:uncharacterized protein PUNSTDRAFT_144177 [Punctularia strigosozonata HHB-11173 SS5]EIN07556.1 hypothetical protein PUNSTDRAFT_144177 [Punctularia strigosozonata HHB-11173 SS5]
MKSFVVLAALLSLVTAAPAGKRAQVCNLSAISDLSIVTASDPSGTIRWDLFDADGFGIQSGQLAWFQESQPDGPAKFRAVGSTNGPTIFTFQRSTDSAEVAQSGSGFASGSGTEFIVSCPATCNLGAGSGELVADQCTMEVSDGSGAGTGQCVSFNGGAQTPVAIGTCDGSTAQQVLFFNNSPEVSDE